MGSYVQLGSLINGSLSTNHSVIWSLRARKCDTLEGYSFTLDNEHIKFLRIKAIKLAMLHGDNGGVSEVLISTALYHWCCMQELECTSIEAP